MKSAIPSPSLTGTLLGTGTSVGVPVIGCDCAVCTSGDPRNIRTRCSLHLQTPDLSLLIDTGPDLREQALREHLGSLDAVLYTHAHLDHVVGFDELRAFCWHRDSPLPLYAGPDTLASLRNMFGWAFENQHRSYVRPDPVVIDGPFTIGGLAITPVPVEHAGIECFGFRFDLPGGHSFAYLCDVKSIPAASAGLLDNLDLLIIDALRPHPHPTHMSLEESLATATRLAPRQTLFTHLGHEIDYEKITSQLPDGVAIAHDGQRFTFQPGVPGSTLHPAHRQPS